MKNSSKLFIKISGFLLTFLGMGMFMILVLLWSTEEYTTRSVSIWPMFLAIGISVMGLICVKAGD